MATARLNREAAAALVKEARRAFENGAQELYASCKDESQRPVIDASVEIIGKLAETVARRWPQETVHGYTMDVFAIDVDLSPATLDWIKADRDSQAGFIADLDAGATGCCEPGYIAEQTYLLHVLEGIVGQTEREVAA